LKEYGCNDSYYEDYFIENYDSMGWGTRDLEEPSSFPEGYNGEYHHGRESTILRLQYQAHSAIKFSFSWYRLTLNHTGTSVIFLSAKDMIPILKRLLKVTVEVLNIPLSAAAVLLREHKWSKDVLFEKFFIDPIKLEQKYGVNYRCNPRRVTTKAKVVCEVFYEAGQPMISMPCEHEFCKDCWRDFCENAISVGPSCVRKSCPESECEEMMTEEEVEQAAPHLLHTFETYHLRSFIESNMFTRWCTGPGCDHIDLASSESTLDQFGKVAKCISCRIHFCFLCGEEPHAPCDCKDAAR
jgi:ariadne-1